MEKDGYAEVWIAVKGKNEECSHINEMKIF